MPCASTTTFQWKCTDRICVCSGKSFNKKTIYDFSGVIKASDITLLFNALRINSENYITALDIVDVAVFNVLIISFSGYKLTEMGMNKILLMCLGKIGKYTGGVKPNELQIVPVCRSI